MPRVSIHDHLQLELKLVHTLARSGEAQGFEAWLYFPNSLGIDEPVFRKEDFYADLTAYVRFQTPELSLAALQSEGLSWLTRERARLCSGAASEAECATALRALRLFAAEFRATARDAIAEMAKTDPAASAARFLDNTRETLQRFRALAAGLQDVRTSEKLRAALSAIDDFLSLHAIDAWFQLLRIFGAEQTNLAEQIRAALRTETDYRIRAGYLGAPSDDPVANEPYISRVNQLKKWVLEVLHLHIVSSRRAERVREAAFSFAAAVAMTVAVALQLVAAWTVGTPKSPQVSGSTLTAFVALAVGGYILKDGIKDRLKIWFQARIPKWLHDRRQELRTEMTGEDFGAVEETVRRISANEVGPQVAQLRETGEDPLLARYRAEEDVIHYRRRFRVDGERARQLAPEMSAVEEILRINVGRWLRRMDDPVRTLTRLEADGRVARVAATKTYRVTMVLARWSRQEAVTYDKVSLVLTRDGLLRVEEMEG